jgi:hypothetical protein
MSKAGQRCFERSDMATLARVVAKTSRCARNHLSCGSPRSPSRGCVTWPNDGVRWPLSTGLCLDAGGGRPPGRLTAAACRPPAVTRSPRLPILSLNSPAAQYNTIQVGLPAPATRHSWVKTRREAFAPLRLSSASAATPAARWSVRCSGTPGRSGRGHGHRERPDRSLSR